jgi:hypothetical protein
VFSTAALVSPQLVDCACGADADGSDGPGLLTHIIVIDSVIDIVFIERFIIIKRS